MHLVYFFYLTLLTIILKADKMMFKITKPGNNNGSVCYRNHHFITRSLITKSPLELQTAMPSPIYLPIHVMNASSYVSN